MNRRFILLALPLAVLTACSSDDGETGDNSGRPMQESKPFVFNVSQEPLTDPDHPGTRTAIQTEETFQTFYMNYYVDGTLGNMNFTTVNKDGAHTWKADKMWPSGNTQNKPVHFFAYANVDYNAADDQYGEGLLMIKEDTKPVQHYLEDIEIDETAAHQKDLLVAQTTQTEPSETTDKVVSLTFSHACAALQFSICKTNSLSAYEIKVNRIILHNIKKKGDYYYNDNSWKNISEDAADKTKFTLFAYDNGTQQTVSIPVENDAHSNSLLLASNADDYMFVIPQTVVGRDENLNGAYIEIVCSIIGGGANDNDCADKEGGSDQTMGSVYLPFADTWEKGYIHRYNIRMGTSLRKHDGNFVFPNS